MKILYGNIMNFDLKHCIPFEGKIQDLATAKVKKGAADPSWNKHLPVPLKNEETVYVHPDQSDVSSGYIKIVQVGEGYQISATFNRGMFSLD